MNIYADVTKEHKVKTFEGIEEKYIHKSDS